MYPDGVCANEDTQKKISEQVVCGPTFQYQHDDEVKKKHKSFFDLNCRIMKNRTNIQDVNCEKHLKV